MRSARTPLLRFLRRAIVASSSKETGPDGDTNIGHSVSRRDFLTGAGIATASLLLGGQSISWAKGQPARIVIVGAGMAGVTVGYTLKRAGFDARIFEASNRIGGRMLSVPGAIVQGAVTEFGGEFIDSDHEDIRSLANEMGLTLLDRRADPHAGLARQAFFLDGRVYTEAEVVEALRPFALTLQADAQVLSAIPTFENPGKAKELDHTTLSHYLADLRLPNWLWKLFEAAFITEYGLELSQQSALNLLITVPTVDAQGHLSMFGESDERFKIAGGNQRLPQALADKLAGQITTGRKLTAISRKGKTYVLTFEGAANTTEVVEADVVVLAIPFSVLRGVRMDIDLPEWKTRAIKELRYGTNTKVMMGFTTRVWKEHGYVGEAFSDECFQLAWDNTELDHIDAGGLTIYTGGNTGVAATKGTVSSQSEINLQLLEKIYPGISDTHTGKTSRMDWINNPTTLGSYASYGPGQWTTIRGAEFKPVGNLHFAGEHCSLDFQGFMNGAAETGRRAAENIIASLK